MAGSGSSMCEERERGCLTLLSDVNGDEFLATLESVAIEDLYSRKAIPHATRVRGIRATTHGSFTVMVESSRD
ncbi:hypothetical protein HDU76_012009, partial [Blyttiomyces sp. JEL0837]